jgi:hypothetical protein
MRQEKIGAGKTNDDKNIVPIFTPRSQAIYGSSVETLGPYPQHYTKHSIFSLTFIILQY